MKIALCNYCNSKCSYCFAGNMGLECASSISFEDFKKVFYLALKNNDKTLYLLGGEPFLNKEIDLILSFLCHMQYIYHIQVIFLTNGVFLNKYINKIPSTVSLLINVNDEKTLGNKESYIKLKDSVNLLLNRGFSTDDFSRKKFCLGCNISDDRDDYDFFWNIVKENNIKIIRASVVSPAEEKYKSNRDLYFKTMKPKFLDFVKKADSLNVKIDLDCSQIPECYFNDTELELINKIKNKNDFLGNCKDKSFQINPDLTISCCFGNRNFESSKINFQQYISYKELDEQIEFLNKQSLKTQYIDKCKDCIKRKNGDCTAGCFGFTDGIIIDE